MDDYAGVREARVANLEALLKAAKCPNCDGSGSIPRQVAEDDWEAEQCQWCAERERILSTVWP